MEENKSTPEKKATLLFVNKEKEPLFSKKNRKLLSDPMDDNNPHYRSGFGYMFRPSNYRSAQTRRSNEYFCYGSNGSE